ncbi:MAG: hypothetical protein IPJ12_19360 [Betaproteobacteria bacterium]|nr:hypothetical protein [Betaproteobacteria bacterium]
MISGPDYAAFAECRGQLFTVAREQEMLAIELTAVEALPAVPGRSQPFSLTFSGPLEPFMQQMTYRLSHPHLGELSVFLVPVESKAGTTHYEAIFN